MTASDLIDPITLARELIRRPSVTPADAGAMDVVETALSGLGFACRRLRFGEIENLYARLGDRGPNFCFAGHTDVVPVGDLTAWTQPPFDAELRDGVIVGRGAVDMKGAIAAAIVAVSNVIGDGGVNGSLSFLITGDEEGQATDGTRAVVAHLKAEGEQIDHCIVGEPTSSKTLGDMIKIGRRGSLNAWITVHGVQGHVAYPERAANPAPVLVKILSRLDAHVLDKGYPEFPPSNLEITEIEIGNPAQNVIPARARARPLAWGRVRAPKTGARQVHAGTNHRRTQAMRGQALGPLPPHLRGPLDPGGDALHPLAVGSLHARLDLGPAAHRGGGGGG